MRKFLISIFFLAIGAFASEKIYVPYFELVNIHSDYQYASMKLLKSYTEGEGKYTMELAPRSDTLVTQPSPTDARTQAEMLNCSGYLLGDFTRLGETVVVSFALYNTADGSLVWSDRLKAASPEDMDPIIQKVARTLGSSTSASKDGNIYSVTKEESKALRQKEANSSVGLSIGGAWIPNLPSEAILGGFGANWLYDTRSILVQLGANVSFGEDDDTFLKLGIDVFYPFFDESWTPFIGGGLSYSLLSYEIDGTYNSYSYSQTENRSGLLFQAGGGILFGRTSTVNVRLRAEYFIGTFKIEGDLTQGVWLGLEAGFDR